MEATLAQHTTGRSAALLLENLGTPSMRALCSASLDHLRNTPDGLVDAGFAVEVVVAYRNVEPTIDPDVLAAAATADLATFTSESTVRRFTGLVGDARPASAACIGPISGAVARQVGYDVVEADPHSVVGLVDAVERWADRP